MKHKQSSKITSLAIKPFHNWIINHYHVKEYLYSNNCIKIKPYGVDEKVSVTKLYLQVPLKYLYDDIIKPPSLGGLD